MENIKLPYITGKTSEEKLNQLHKYIYQLVEQLNYNFGQNGNVEKSDKEEEEKTNAFTNLFIGGTLTLGSMNDASGTSAPDGIPLVIGDSEGTHLEIDNNEIIAKSDATTTSQINLHELKVGTLTVGSTEGDATVNRIVKSFSGGSDSHLPTSKAVVDYVGSHNAGGIVNETVSVDYNTTNASAYSGRCMAVKFGSVTAVFFRGRFTRKATMSANTNYTIGSIADAYKPSMAQPLSIYASASGGAPLAYISNAGEIVVRQTSAVNNSTYFYINGFWFLT